MLVWERFAPPQGWTRNGAEWRGCCPVTGEGRTRAWAAPGRGLLGCRHCGDGGGRLAGADFAAHAAAVGVLADRWQPAPHPRPVTRAPAPPSDLADGAALVASVWRRAAPLADSPGAAYLQQRIGWAAPWPSALRWLPADAFADVRPRPPDGAAGCIVYALTARDRPTGLQLEAVAADGAALRFAGAGKRPSVRGSRMRGAVFVARPGAAGAGVWLAESALDALAVLALALPPADVAVLAAAGAGGVRYGALPPDAGPVTVAAQNDPAGRAAAFRIGAALEVRRRPWYVRMPLGAGADWADVAGEVAAERAAIQWEGAADA